VAGKRMFSDKIVESDAFTDMPLSAQALYFHFNMGADDDGIVNNPKRLCRSIGASEDDLKLLIAKQFLISFDSGIVVIKHWRMHNNLRKDRYTPTAYQDEFSMLEVKENGAYTLVAKWLPNGCQMVAIDKSSSSKEENSLVESSSSSSNYGNHNESDVENSNVENSKLEYMGGELGKGVVLLSENQQEALLEKLGFDAFNFYVAKLATFIIEKGAKVGNHYSTILKWAREDARV
jgi:hypothetical protein